MRSLILQVKIFHRRHVTAMPCTCHAHAMQRQHSLDNHAGYEYEELACGSNRIRRSRHILDDG